MFIRSFTSISFNLYITASAVSSLVNAGALINGANGSIYYDLFGDCTGQESEAKEAAHSDFNDSPNACGYRARSIGNSRLVAIPPQLWSTQLCGAEIVITHDGQSTPFVPSEGPLFVGDMCKSCPWNQFDFGAKAAVDLSEGAGCKNPKGFSLQITDNIIGPVLSDTVDALLPQWFANEGGALSSAAPSSWSATSTYSSTTSSSWPSTANGIITSEVSSSPSPWESSAAYNVATVQPVSSRLSTAIDLGTSKVTATSSGRRPPTVAALDMKNASSASSSPVSSMDIMGGQPTNSGALLAQESSVTSTTCRRVKKRRRRRRRPFVKPIRRGKRERGHVYIQWREHMNCDPDTCLGGREQMKTAIVKPND
ncbi:uncharacterized protein IL334_006701 [Kwoniella shivajii]|uniref:Expansin-like EG45 domain-containing protein n=1 Tax=Kwoniella shivajii TaxID=564305 RepID=A0ABZ1D9Q3_9TREE|nr:hypothetical protein IL334_006701 [Kwoniella shivajii]